jgi:RimJ/RimL family protein N-acetyltransferase
MKISKITESDRAFFRSLLSIPEVCIPYYIGDPFLESELDEEFSYYLESNPLYVIRLNEKPVGLIGIHPFLARINGTMESWSISYAILPEYQGRGVCSEAVKLALVEFRDNHPFASIYGATSINNEGSIRVLLKAGFKVCELGNETDEELIFKKPNIIFETFTTWVRM